MFCADPFLGKMNLIAGFVQCKKGQFEDHTYRRRNQECFRPSFGAVVLQYPICVQSGKHKVRVFEFRRVGHPFRIVVHRTKVPVSICGELAGEIMIEAFRGKSWRPDRSLALFLKRNDYVLLDGIFLEA